MVHAPGNNYKCDKILSINVPLVNPALVNAVLGTYFLPDIPELTNKEIVGIVGSRTIGENFRDIQNQICWTGSYLTIYDMNNIILYDRFPVPALYNYDVNTAGGLNFSKIPPINNKINLRQSFITFAQGQNFAPSGKTLAIGLTFFYNYK